MASAFRMPRGSSLGFSPSSSNGGFGEGEVDRLYIGAAELVLDDDVRCHVDDLGDEVRLEAPHQGVDGNEKADAQRHAEDRDHGLPPAVP